MFALALRPAACAGILTLLTLGGCGGPATAPEVPGEPAFIRGSITRVGDGWGYLVEGTPAAWHREDRAYFTATGATILRRGGGRAGAAELAVGRAVSVWITGPVRESYPVQVDARVIVLEPDSVAAR